MGPSPGHHLLSLPGADPGSTFRGDDFSKIFWSSIITGLLLQE